MTEQKSKSWGGWEPRATEEEIPEEVEEVIVQGEVTIEEERPPMVLYGANLDRLRLTPDTPLDLRAIEKLFGWTKGTAKRYRNRRQLPPPSGMVSRSPWWRTEIILYWAMETNRTTKIRYPKSKATPATAQRPAR
jgi:hypothetical protein